MMFRPDISGARGGLSLEMDGVAMRSREELADRVEQLYEEHYEGIYRYLVYTGHQCADADEFTQEAFLRLFKSLRDGNRIEKPKNWLFGAVHRIRVDENRRAMRTVEYDAMHVEAWEAKAVDPGPTPEAEVLQQERSEQMRRALAQLTERQYQYLLLRTEGLKLREIAEIFRVTVQSVAEACTRAMDRMGRLMHE
jgi:RNA polymerase sigma-70 factor, ECF subfamily